MSDLLELAARCEAATGPDRFLDAQIASVIRLEKVPDWARNWTGKWKATEVGSVVLMEDSGNPGPHFMAREYTTSLDAAMTLVPRGWIALLVRDFDDDGDYFSTVKLTDSFSVARGSDADDEVTVMVRKGCCRAGGDPTALALTAACLRARASVTPTGNPSSGTTAPHNNPGLGVAGEGDRP